MTESARELAGALSVELNEPFNVAQQKRAERIIAALSAAGFAIVPVEIDTGNIPLIEALNGGGCQGWGGHIINEHVADARRKWKRILSALLTASKENT